MDENVKESHGVQSLEIGIGVLRVLVEAGAPLMLKEIAHAADIPASKAHRYMVSLVRVGLVEQDPATSKYDLGPFALNLGLAAVDRLDRVQLGLESIAQLRDLTHETTALAVWGDFGPVVIRWERPRRPITVNVLTGKTVSLVGSATGRVFCAWMPSTLVHPLIERELKDARDPELKNMAQVERALREVRAQGFAFVRESGYSHGVLGMAAPVFNFKNDITMAVLIVGIEGVSDLGPESFVRTELKRCAAELSKRLGASMQSDTKNILPS